MSDVINLTHYARQRDASANTSIASASVEGSWYRPVEATGTGGLLSASILRRLDVDSELGRFVGLAEDAIERLSTCQGLLGSGDALGADDQLLACKPLFAEMLMYRDLSDAVGLIVLKCFQVANSVKAIVDAKALPSALERALTRVCSAPFMTFEAACELADMIDASASLMPVPGMAPLASALAEAAQSTADAGDNG